MTGAEYAGWLCVAALGLCGSALCSGTETGLYSVNRVRLSIRLGRSGGAGRSARRLQRELERPERAIATLLIANVIFNSLGATALTALLEGAGRSELEVVLINIVVLTPLVIIFGEVLPKETFRVGADRLMYRAIWFVTAARWLMTIVPVVPVIRFVVRLMARALGVESEAGFSTERERIAALIKEGAKHGVLSEAQTTLLDRALAFRNTTVGDEMVPWPRVATIGERWPRRRVLDVLRAQPFSRFPVVNSVGRVVGVVEALDISLNPRAPIEELMRPAAALDPNLPVREGLIALRQQGARLATVVSRGGRRPLGIVTAKDLVEPLTGELAAW